MPPSTVPNLSQSQLSGLPQRNSVEFLLDYLKEQRQLQGYYASCSPNAVLSTEHRQSTSGLAATAAVFDTPLLKARVPDTNPTITQRVARPKESTTQPPFQRTTSKQHNTEPGPKCPRKPPITHKEVDEESNSQDDGSDSHVERLAIRRARRKERKSMTKAQESRNPSRNGTGQPEDDAQKGKGKVAKQAKLPVGLALMHGFSATNVGKNRLTIDPPVLKTIGVFSRGRASDTTGSKQGKAPENGIQFSEQNFLNKTRARQSQGNSAKRKYETAGESDIDGDTSSAPRKHRKHRKKRRKHKSGKKRAIAEDEATPEDRSDRSEQGHVTEDDGCEDEVAATERASSVIWDIERSSAVLASSVANISAGNPGTTVVMQLPNSLRRPFEDDDSPSEPVRAIVHGASHSLAPSESASQLPRNSALRPGDPHLSRYFTTDERVSAPPPAFPTNGRQVPLSDVGRRSTSNALLSPRSSLLRSPVISHVSLPAPILSSQSASAGSWLPENDYDIASCLNDRDNLYTQHDNPTPYGYDLSGSSYSVGLPLATQQWEGSSMFAPVYSYHPEPSYAPASPTCYVPLWTAPCFDQGYIWPQGYLYSEPTALFPWFNVPQAGETTGYPAPYVLSGYNSPGAVAVDPQDLTDYGYYPAESETPHADEGDSAPEAYLTDEGGDVDDVPAAYQTDDGEDGDVDVDASSEVGDEDGGLDQNQFIEGRALLYGWIGADGYCNLATAPTPPSGTLPYAEMDVVQRLRAGHWLPQRL